MLTKPYSKVIIFKHLRECWNGRQARLRCVWFRRVGSSPISRTKKEEDTFRCPPLFNMDWGLEQFKYNSPVDYCGDGSTEPNIYLRNAQMQTCPISRTKKKRMLKGILFFFHL